VPGNPPHTDLAVINLTVPSAPSIVGRLTLPVWANALSLVGSLAYLSTNTGLQIADVSSPTALQLRGAVTLPARAYGTAVANGYAYVADYTSLQVVNVQNPSAPSVVGSLAGTNVGAVAVAGTHAYICGATFDIIDISNPSVPLRVSTMSFPMSPTGVSV